MTASCGPGWGKNLYRLVRILIKKPCNGYYLRWWYNGWHYWFFLPGTLTFDTEGEKYVTLGTQKVAMGSGQVDEGQIAAIRTIMNSREVYIWTDSGWGNVRIEPGSLIVYDNKVSGYEMEFVAVLGSKSVSKTDGFTPIITIPPVIPIPPSFCQVVIGTQIWMCKNYDSDFPGSKVYNDDEANRAIWGGLYTWAQVTTPGFCPAGWHVPTLAEWQTAIAFIEAISGAGTAGGELKEVGLTHWNAPNTGATDTYTFKFLASGQLASGIYVNMYVNGKLWTATESGFTAEAIRASYNSAALLTESLSKLADYVAVRLIKDTPFTGFSDWFLPSIDEMSEMYDVLWDDPSPIGGFTIDDYHSSTEFSATQNKTISFTMGGAIFNDDKDIDYSVRACRAFTSITVYALRDIGPAGGFIFWKSGNDYLEAAPYDQTILGTGQKIWSNIDAVAIGTTGSAIGTGQANTLAIIGQFGHIDSAAKLCNDLDL
jgi:uncharacterized protein (TIGR02145 family)